MAETRLIAVADLLMDEHNPRLSTVDAGQRISLRDMAEHEPDKLVELAESIATHGMSPADLPIVTRHPTQRGKYTVLEGNRRLCALLALESPQVLGASVDESIRRRFASASSAYHKHPIENLLCCVMDRDEARYWIILRHTGENRGAGVVRWGTIEQSRFNGNPDPTLEILDELQTNNLVSSADIAAITPTNFQRIIETRAVREHLGFSINEGRVHYDVPWSKVAKVFVRIIEDLKSRKLTVNRLRSVQDRIDYIREISPPLAGNAARKTGSANNDRPSSTAQQTGAAGRPGSRKARTASGEPAPRSSLIPSDCRLNVTEPRIANIERELRLLPLDKFPNAVAIMFRVFLELSVESYIKRAKVSIHANSKLAQKVSSTITALEKAGALGVAEARAARSATQANTLLATSTTTLNQYVHNPHWSPSPTELRASWDRLQPLFAAVWPV